MAKVVAVLLFILFAYQISCGDGRHIKPTKHTQVKYTEKRCSTKQATPLTHSNQNEGKQKAGIFEETPSAQHPRAPLHQGDTSPTIETKGSFLRADITAYEDDFRPTRPGKSPGAGHSSEGSRVNTKGPVEGKHNFQPTAPIGSHSLVLERSISTDKKETPKARPSRAAYTDLFYRPTHRYRSPGIGHVRP